MAPPLGGQGAPAPRALTAAHGRLRHNGTRQRPHAGNTPMTDESGQQGQAGRSRSAMIGRLGRGLVRRGPDRPITPTGRPPCSPAAPSTTQQCATRTADGGGAADEVLGARAHRARGPGQVPVTITSHTRRSTYSHATTPGVAPPVQRRTHAVATGTSSRAGVPASQRVSRTGVDQPGR